MFQVYLAKLEEDMSGMLGRGEPVKEIWAEVHSVSDYFMLVIRRSHQSTGWTMS